MTEGQRKRKGKMVRREAREEKRESDSMEVDIFGCFMAGF